MFKRFGKLLKKIRRAKGFTQEKLAFESNLSANYVGRIERGQVNPTLDTIYKISKALNVSVSELTKGL